MRVKRKKVFVGLSGGVDSSVSAALLKEQGYDVTGVFIKVWQADFLPCTWREERRDAMRAAAHLGIPFLTLSLEEEYKKEVVDYMIREYGAGRVPNPDVMCNKHVKFGAFLDFALARGADFIATGHYARIQSSVISRQSLGKFKLLKGSDAEKDQSYFLWTLTQEQLAHTLFPVGHLQKSEVRALAQKFGLPNAEKKDSQGLCFMGKVDMAEFLKHYLQTQKGDVLDTNGKIIGTHEGAMLYTIGQRHGFLVEKKSANEKPYFVIDKELAQNSITVAHRDPSDTLGKFRVVKLKECNNISEKFDCGVEIACLARIRYRGALIPATCKMVGKLLDTSETPLMMEAQVVYEKPESDITEGQSLVLYLGDECLGGGIVCGMA